MQGQSSDAEMIKSVEQRRAEVLGWVRDLGFLEAWKKVADQGAHRIFGAVRISGPFMPDGQKKTAVDEIYRHTLWGFFDCMTRGRGERCLSRKPRRQVAPVRAAHCAPRASTNARMPDEITKRYYEKMMVHGAGRVRQ